MTNTTNTTTEEPNEDPVEALEPVTEPQAPQEPGEGTEDAAPVTKADREARLRKRAQEAETERDQLRELIGGLRRGEVERRLSGVLTNPSDVWHAATLEDLLDESGVIDAAKLATVTETIKLAHPNWAAPQQLQGNLRPAGPVSQARETESEDRWQGAFTPKPIR